MHNLEKFEIKIYISTTYKLRKFVDAERSISLWDTFFKIPGIKIKKN